MPFFRHQRQYQNKTDPLVPIIPPAVTAIVTAALSSQIIFGSYLIYQSHTEPAFVPAETITVDKWIKPFNEPVRVKIDPRLAVVLSVNASAYSPQPQAQIIPTTTSPVVFPRTFQYPALTQPTFVETTTIDKWGYSWSEPVRTRRLPTSEYQAQIQGSWVIPLDIDQWIYPWSEPVRTRRLATSQQPFSAYSTTEISSVDKWFKPFNEPVRFKRIHASAQAPSFTAPPEVITPTNPTFSAFTSSISSEVTFRQWIIYESEFRSVFTPETSTVDKWTYPWSAPVRFRTFPTSEQQSYAAPTYIPETITVDKWVYPWTEPVRQKIGLKTYLQQAAIGPVLEPETQIIQGYESRWHFAWSEPVRIKKQLPAGEQQFQIQGPPQTPEFITVDKWIYPWTDPVKQKIGLRTNLQQAFIAPVLDDETQLIQGFESRWHYAWSEPVRFRVFPVAEQQAFTIGLPSFEIITTDKWTYPWSEPVRQKPGLKTNLQQAFIGLTLEPETQIIQGYESRWHFAWSEPVRQKPQLPAGEQQTVIQGPVQTPEFITVDKWIYAWTDPVRQKIGLKAHLQQAFIAPVLSDEQLTGTFESRWHEPWSEPVRFRRFPAAEQQSFAAPATSVFETITVDKWIYPWTDPVKQKVGLKTHLQQAFIATTLEPETQIIQTYESRWHQPWSEPTRRKVSVANQPASVWSPFTPAAAEIITVDKWFESLSEPVRFRSFATAQQQAIAEPVLINPFIISTASSPVIFNKAFQYPSQTAPIAPIAVEIVTIDKWLYQLSEPVRFRIDPRRAIALAAPSAIGPVLNPNTQISQFFESRWHYAWSEPKRFKQGLGAWLQDTTTPKTPIFPTGVARLNQWFAPFSQPVRLRPGLMAALQRFFQTSQEQILPDVFVTLSATEVNGDSAFFGVTSYNAVPVVSRVPTTVVSIKEIPATRKAAVSTEEIPAIDNASVSIEET